MSNLVSFTGLLAVRCMFACFSQIPVLKSQSSNHFQRRKYSFATNLLCSPCLSFVSEFHRFTPSILLPTIIRIQVASLA